MKILLAISGSHDESADPIDAVASFPWPHGSEIRVLTVSAVFEPAMVGVLPGVPAIPDVGEAQLEADSEAKMTEGIALEGHPETAITDYAKEWGADLIVVGSHNRSLTERSLMGSVSQSVVKHSPCSVLVIKPRLAT